MWRKTIQNKTRNKTTQAELAELLGVQPSHNLVMKRKT